jgi:hypothetical protein
MADIKIRKKSEAQIYIECDSGIASELSENFTFYAPGYKFIPSYRNKLWDGKIRLFDMRSRLLPAGLLKYVNHFAKTREYSIESEIVKHTPSFDILSKIPLTSGGKSIQPRDYQLEAVKKAITDKTALLVSPTASGKSLIIYLMMRWFLANHQSKVLVVVPTTSLTHQMKSDFVDYATTELPDLGNHIHVIHAGQEKDDMRKINITLENDDIISLTANTKVKLLGGTWKFAKDINKNDEIDDKWLLKQ